MTESSPYPNPKEQLSLQITVLEAEREELRKAVREAVPSPILRQEVTAYVINFFKTIELLKSQIGTSLKDAEEGRITKIDETTYTEFNKNMDFIRTDLLPFIEMKPEDGEPIDQKTLETIRTRLTETDIILARLK